MNEPSPTSVPIEASEVEGWLRERLATLFCVPVDDVDIHAFLVDYGIDSVQVVEISDDITARYGVTLPTSLVLPYQTIAQLAVSVVSIKAGAPS